jgi:hypothetical protein
MGYDEEPEEMLLISIKVYKNKISIMLKY